MAYIGNNTDHNAEIFTTSKDRFSGNASTTAFTLSAVPANAESMQVFVNNVRQDSGRAYTVSGTTLTFTEAPSSATGNIYAVYNSVIAGIHQVITANTQLRTDVVTPHALSNTSTYSVGELLVAGQITVSGGDTSAGDNAALGYTAAEGLILTGQGSTSDITIKNDADADVITIATGGTNVDIVGDITAATVNADGDTSAGDNAAIGYTAAEGLILTGQGSTSDITLKNDADATVFTVPTGTDDIKFPDGAKVIWGNDSDLSIYENSGSATFLASGGNVRFYTQDFGISNAGASETMLNAVQNGAVSLYYDNAVKLATKTDGVDITGELQSDTLDVDGAGDISGNLALGGTLTTTGITYIPNGSMAAPSLTFTNDTNTGITNNGALNNFYISIDGSMRVAVGSVIQFGCDGSAGTAALSFNGDWNTGLYHPAGDQLAITTQGVERLRVDANGLVGIRTSAPHSNQLIHMYGGASGGAGSTDIGMTIENSGDSQLQFLAPESAGYTSRINFGSVTNARDGMIAYTQSAKYMAFHAANAEKLRLNSTGLGIGTSSPAAALDVTNGEIRMTDGRNLQWGGANCRIQGTNASSFEVFTGGSSSVNVDGNGIITAPKQSSFYATCAALANKTGNATTTYIVGSSGYTWTEVQDRNADFNAAGLFTAPVSGFYHMSGTMQFSGLNSANSGVAYLIVSNGNIQILHNPTSIANVSTNYNINISQVVFMDANDTAQIAMYINGAGSDVCDLDSAQFSGYLLG